MSLSYFDVLTQAEVEGKVTRDDFTMMVRRIVRLDLEPEEEDILYRIMTVFGRSQELRRMEEQFRNNPLMYVYSLTLFRKRGPSPIIFDHLFIGKHHNLAGVIS